MPAHRERFSTSWLSGPGHVHALTQMRSLPSLIRLPRSLSLPLSSRQLRCTIIPFLLFLPAACFWPDISSTPFSLAWLKFVNAFLRERAWERQGVTLDSRPALWRVRTSVTTAGANGCRGSCRALTSSFTCPVPPLHLRIPVLKHATGALRTHQRVRESRLSVWSFVGYCSTFPLRLAYGLGRGSLTQPEVSETVSRFSRINFLFYRSLVLGSIQFPVVGMFVRRSGCWDRQCLCPPPHRSNLHSFCSPAACICTTSDSVRWEWSNHCMTGDQ
ncbi:hypothetical protein EXIGLDRAFT_278539 [Exidia glandulosa HHB12029]|uniref:Uncharacterized protein n=1 Tax=Exidia glandulosa HHB12029 TaxID=1314781 RepID=A0A165DKA3_EXIGL|nr:hypothetical protein EXIGLDRAFT_278539 [Exidia glandulosa HHB12029]